MPATEEAIESGLPDICGIPGLTTSMKDMVSDHESVRRRRLACCTVTVKSWRFAMLMPRALAVTDLRLPVIAEVTGPGLLNMVMEQETAIETAPAFVGATVGPCVGDMDGSGVGRGVGFSVARHDDCPFDGWNRP